MNKVGLITSVGVEFLDLTKCSAGIRTAAESQKTVGFRKEVEVPSDLREAVKVMGEKEAFDALLENYTLKLHGVHRKEILSKLGKEGVKTAGKERAAFSL